MILPCPFFFGPEGVLPKSQDTFVTYIASGIDFGKRQKYYKNS